MILFEYVTHDKVSFNITAPMPVMQAIEWHRTTIVFLGVDEWPGHPRTKQVQSEATTTTTEECTYVRRSLTRGIGFQHSYFSRGDSWWPFCVSRSNVFFVKANSVVEHAGLKWANLCVACNECAWSTYLFACCLRCNSAFYAAFGDIEEVDGRFSYCRILHIFNVQSVAQRNS